MDTPTPSRLERLPAELRRKIWVYLLDAAYNTSLDHTFPHNQRHAYSPAALGASALRDPDAVHAAALSDERIQYVADFPTAIFRVNRFLSQDAQSCFFEVNAFTMVSYPDVPLYPGLYPGSCTISSLQVRNLNFPVHITISCDETALCHSVVSVQHLEGFLANKLSHILMDTGTNIHGPGTHFNITTTPGKIPVRLSGVLQRTASVFGRELPGEFHQVLWRIPEDSGDLDHAHILATYGKRFRLDMDHLFRHGMLFDAWSGYFELTVKTSPRELVEAVELLPKGDQKRETVIDFICTDIVDSGINIYVNNLMSGSADVRELESPFHEAVALLTVLTGESGVKLRNKIANLWVLAAARLELNESIVDLVPCHAATLEDPQPLYSPERWADIEERASKRCEGLVAFRRESFSGAPFWRGLM